jgi:hypothetical protein
MQEMMFLRIVLALMLPVDPIEHIAVVVVVEGYRLHPYQQASKTMSTYEI